MKPSDLRLCEAIISTQLVPYRTPIKFSGRVVREALIMDVAVEAETRDGRRGRGCGSMPLGNVWAWPSTVVGPAQTQSAMLALAEELVRQANDDRPLGHPLEITRRPGRLPCGNVASRGSSRRRAAGGDSGAGATGRRQPLGSGHPRRLRQDPRPQQLRPPGAGMGRRATLRPIWTNGSRASISTVIPSGTAADDAPVSPRRRLDPLSDADLASPVGDGLPESLAEWIAADGLTHLKIKLNGDDLDWDVQRVLSVEGVAAEAQAARGCRDWRYSADFNEKCGSVEYVIEFLARIGEGRPQSLRRLQYVEQPMPRPAFGGGGVDAAAKIKPVVIDESLVDYESLLLARELGYSGVALEACKGQSEALLDGGGGGEVWHVPLRPGFDLPGRSFLHSAALAARIPGVAAIEGNARQYCPAANGGWAKRFPTMFHITDGTAGTACSTDRDWDSN